ncbi:MAG: lipocalin-like domain-containing protein [Bryobacteraceae bacterium]
MNTSLIPTHLFAVDGAAPSANSDDVGLFLGSWKLISYELTLTSGSTLKPFGDHPVGLILYQNDGHMSAQLMLPAPIPFASSDSLQATKDEAERAWRNYAGYWGTFSVDTNNRIITHHVEGGWFPNWIGTNQARSFRFGEGTLILEADYAGGLAKLVWQKSD